MTKVNKGSEFASVNVVEQITKYTFLFIRLHSKFLPIMPMGADTTDGFNATTEIWGAALSLPNFTANISRIVTVIKNRNNIE